MLVIPQDYKKKILSVVMDFIRAEDLKFNDDFPIKISHVYSSIIEGESKLPEPVTFIKKASKIKTTFFRINSRIRKRTFLEEVLDKLNNEFAPVLTELQKKKPVIEALPMGVTYERIYVDEIDSFKKVKKVSSKAVRNIVPLTISEKEVKLSLADIIGEKFVRKDWAGEKSDLYSSFVIIKGKRVSTAFLLKGPSVKRLTIDKCGKRGNQILRLTKEPARLFVVQSNGEIDTDVIELLETCISDLSRKKNEKFFYCIMDGVDTARVLRAYGKI